MPLDEGTLRERFPEIPWDQPVRVSVLDVTYFVCRYCIATYGLKGSEIENTEHAFYSRRHALDHIERAHHE